MNINVRAPFVAIRTAQASMPDGGRIINIGSCLATRAGRPGVALYAASKSALIGLSQGLARDLGPRGITVNVVHPGPINTDMNPANGEHASELVAVLSLPHYGEPRDIAGMVAFLAGPEGRYVTGASLAVDGGYAA
ncbi:Cyclic-di-GMP-binding biofilm dispersal mediator protein [compost metagenome]